MKLSKSRIEKGIITSYSTPEKFIIVCKKCDYIGCELTIIDYSKVKIFCPVCKEEEK